MMSMFERIAEDSIFIDFGSEIVYGSDQVYVSHPERFAAVSFQLMGTPLLTSIADRIRKDAGFAPMSPMDEYTEDTCDGDGWYEFYIGISDRYEGAVDALIEAVVCNSSSADEGGTYSIDLSMEEQGCIYSRLDEQCRKYLGKGCAELLREAREKMEELYYKGFSAYRFMPEETADAECGEEDKGEDILDAQINTQEAKESEGDEG